jgi:hypothetical protein
MVLAGPGIAPYALGVSRMPSSTDNPQRSSTALVVLRYVLPLAVTVVGIVFMAMGGETELEGGAAIVSAGLAIFLLNWLFRAGVAGERERDAEDRARQYFDRHGRWPD